MIQRTTRNVTVMPNAVPSDPEAKKQASSPWQEENQEGLEALNSFHAEYGHLVVTNRGASRESRRPDRRAQRQC